METKQEKIILGVKITDLSWSEVANETRAMLANQRQNLICTPNPEICLAAEKNETFKRLLNSATINAPDGFGLKIGALILGQWIKHRITGVDLTLKLCEIAEQQNCSVLFLGGQWKVAEDAAEIVRKKYPTIKIMGDKGLNKIWMDDKKLFYDTRENELLLERINKIAPTILCVAFGAPQQELWIKENLNKLPSVKIAIGVGGTLDYLAGRLPRAPKFLRALGLEWLFRLIVQPSGRIKRIFNAVIQFPINCLCWRARMLFKRNEQHLSVMLNETGKILIVQNKKTGKWILPNMRNNDIKTFEDNIGITAKQFSILKPDFEETTINYPAPIKLATGQKGEKYHLALIKLIGHNQSLQLPLESEWQDYKWVTREVLAENLSPMLCDLAEKISDRLRGC